MVLVWSESTFDLQYVSRYQLLSNDPQIITNNLQSIRLPPRSEVSFELLGESWVNRVGGTYDFKLSNI